MTREEVLDNLKELLRVELTWIDSDYHNQNTIETFELAIAALEEQEEWELWPMCPKCGHTFKVETRHHVKKEGECHR